ncbi:hypothetical protein ANCCEY_03070 [Ancylostoma ceylanicum]|uniref:SCP domain-containing protein n=1 Tax=Ancylostoma ceylanicum TaxID=53326 RepID=A0A0D6MBK8_9BILA|nr:hypothetical protein ANCCEY_03070 [Ancylostoma ceylanicum]
MWSTSAVWDCTIEQHAFETACTGTVDKQKFSENKATFKSRTCNDTEATKKLLKTWWDEARQVDLDASQKYEQTLEHFGPMAADVATRFGCSYAACAGSESTLHCVYNQKLEIGTDNVYEAANPDACQCDQNAPCVAYLCQTASTAGELMIT